MIHGIGAILKRQGQVLFGHPTPRGIQVIAALVLLDENFHSAFDV
jgi:hypothetical protein